jgi:hypothetical protein
MQGAGKANEVEAAKPRARDEYENRLIVLETRVRQLETQLAAEKQTREKIDQDLSNSIAESGQSALSEAQSVRDLHYSHLKAAHGTGQ